MTLDIPNGTPLLYQLDPDVRPLTPGGRYLSSRQEAGHAQAGHHDRGPA